MRKTEKPGAKDYANKNLSTVVFTQNILCKITDATKQKNKMVQ